MPGSLDARVRDVFEQVIDRAGADRALQLERCCAGDALLRERVEVLLAAAEKDDSFLADPTLVVDRSASSRQPGEQPGTRIGPYTLIKLIGEGGFGSVFLARQSSPVQRDVALKIIKAGMDTKQVIARFEIERQALALMDHPNIARVLEAGATEFGRPYFVMELVGGEPITRYCNRELLSIDQRLDLFRSVCAAVQHAHQKGVIHRDLKPSNILVTRTDGAPLVKVIDFGIAKATGPGLNGQTLTELHQLVGTPEYMSPEQMDAAGMDIDTRTDVYSLGVVLYELLTGMTPFDRQRLASSGFDGMRQIVRKEEPPRPSARLRSMADSSAAGRPAATVAAGAGSSVLTVADRRRIAPTSLVQSLSRDLDWLVLKCLEKERARRYETASALADDIGRYLADQPVLATPPSAGYRLRKFVRRNRGAVMGVATIAATLVAAAGISIAFALSEARQRAIAQKAENAAQQVSLFQQKQLAGIDVRTMGVRLRADLIEKARAAAERSNLPPDEAGARIEQLEALIAGSDFTGIALETLDENVFQPALAAIEKDYADQPVTQARLFQTLAGTMRQLGLFQAATTPQERALEIRRRILGPEHPDTLEALQDFGHLLYSQGKLPQAETALRDALEKRRRVEGNDHPGTLKTMDNLGVVLQSQGKAVEGESVLREALDGFRRVLGSDHADTLTAINNMGFFLQAQGRRAEAEAHFREALESMRRVLGGEHPMPLAVANNVGFILQAQGKLPEAEEFLRESLEGRRAVLGNEHADTLVSISNMGMLLRASRQPAAAEPLLREAVQTARRVLGPENPSTLVYTINLCNLLQESGQKTEAEAIYRAELDRVRRVFGNDHQQTQNVILNLGVIVLERGQTAEAEPYFRESLESSRRLRGDEHAVTLNATGRLADVLLRMEKPAEVIELLAPHEAVARRTYAGSEALRLARWLLCLGRAQLKTRAIDQAEANLKEAADIFQTGGKLSQRDQANLSAGRAELDAARSAADSRD